MALPSTQSIMSESAILAVASESAHEITNSWIAFGSKIDPPKVSGYATNSSPFSVGSDCRIRIPLFSRGETALKIGFPSQIDGGRGSNQGCCHPSQIAGSIFCQR